VLCGGAEARAGDAISQPGPLFLGPNPAHQIAQLRRWVSPERQYDTAIAAVAPGVRVDTTLLDGGVRIKGMLAPKAGMTMVKAGAASGVTHALIDGVGGSYLVPYGDFGDADRWMLGMRLVPAPKFHDRDVSLPGDSGSVWVDADSGMAIGLNFAGEDDIDPLNEYALAHSMTAVCDLMEIDIAATP
jgi:hypothetical protein